MPALELVWDFVDRSTPKKCRFSIKLGVADASLQILRVFIQCQACIPLGLRRCVWDRHLQIFVIWPLGPVILDATRDRIDPMWLFSAEIRRKMVTSADSWCWRRHAFLERCPASRNDCTTMDATAEMEVPPNAGGCLFVAFFSFHQLNMCCFFILPIIKICQNDKSMNWWTIWGPTILSPLVPLAILFSAREKCGPAGLGFPWRVPRWYNPTKIDELY